MNPTPAEPIRNKVAESGILTLDLAPLLPAPESIALFDLQPFLFMGMILREKDYRAALQTHDWAQYAGRHVGILCSADAVIPVWAYMLAASQLHGVAASIHYGPAETVATEVLRERIHALPVDVYAGKRMVLKGCGDVAVPAAAYVAATDRLQGVAKSIMYGEPCSTVPVFKNKG